jgi:tRNA threonylcarbamoyladenosine biosynthesis protein TsaE
MFQQLPLPLVVPGTGKFNPFVLWIHAAGPLGLPVSHALDYLCQMEWILRLDNMQSVAQQFWRSHSGKKIFAFHGQMGAGKTTFIRALSEAAMVQSRVGSPTFSIINEYAYPAGNLYHIDLYRIKDEEEMIRAGVEECLYSGSVCLIEWPELASGILPSETTHVYVDMVSPTERHIHTRPSP